jgi:hypothetical protein
MRFALMSVAPFCGGGNWALTCDQTLDQAQAGFGLAFSVLATGVTRNCGPPDACPSATRE